MRSFKQYLEEQEGSIFGRIKSALGTFIENRQGLLQDKRLGFDPDEVAEPFGELTFDGADKATLEDAIKKVEKLATRIDDNAGSNLYEALSDLVHRADKLEGIRDLHKEFSWLINMDEVRRAKSSRS